MPNIHFLTLQQGAGFNPIDDVIVYIGDCDSANNIGKGIYEYK